MEGSSCGQFKILSWHSLGENKEGKPWKTPNSWYSNWDLVRALTKYKWEALMLQYHPQWRQHPPPILAGQLLITDVLLVFADYMNCDTSRDEKGTESAARKTGQDIKWHIKWLGLCVRSLGTLRYTSGMMFLTCGKLQHQATIWSPRQWRTQEFFSGGFNKFSWGQRTERTGIWGQ